MKDSPAADGGPVTEDQPITAGARTRRIAGRCLVPALLVLALLGVAAAVCPPKRKNHMRPVAASVEVMDPGGRVVPAGLMGEGEDHPRLLKIERTRSPLPPDADDAGAADGGGWGVHLTRRHVSLSGRRPRPGDERRWRTTLWVSGWVILASVAAAGLAWALAPWAWSAAGWRRAGPEPHPRRRPCVLRAAARPWLWCAAGLGAALLMFTGELPGLPGSGVLVAAKRGRIEAPHARLVTVRVDGAERPWTREFEEASLAKWSWGEEATGLRWEREGIYLLRGAGGDPIAGRPRMTLTVSLWYLLAIPTAWSAVAATRRMRRRIP